MVWSKVEPIEEVGSQDRLTDVGDYECEIEFSIGNVDLTVDEAVAGNVGAVRCL